MSAVEVFQFPATGQQIRTVLIDDVPWFVGRDVATVLGYANGRRDIARHTSERQRGEYRIGTPSGEQTAVVVSEPGVYRLIMRSNMPKAVEFQDWLAEEVLPAIRRTGRYEVAPALPQTYAQALRELAASVERTEQIERELEAVAPKAEAWDVLASAHGDYSVREAAFILSRDPAIDTGQNRLFRLLRDFGLIGANGVPYAAHERHVRLRARHYTKPSGSEETAHQVRITADGLRYLHRRMGGSEPLAA